MNIFNWLFKRGEREDYNPGDDPLITERVRISDRAEHLSNLAEEVQRRMARGRFPILLDEPVETPRW